MVPNGILIDGCLVSILSLERLPLAPDGSRDRDSQLDTMRRDSKVEVYIRTFPSEDMKGKKACRSQKF